MNNNSEIGLVLSDHKAKVSYTGGALKTWVGDFPPNNPDTTYDLTYRYWHEWAPTTYYYQVVEKSNFEKAFKIVRSLMEKGHIKELTVKKFSELVEEMAKEI